MRRSIPHPQDALQRRTNGPTTGVGELLVMLSSDGLYFYHDGV